MEFSVPRRRSRIEPIVPMINIVFLLLIFFLMTATIAPPEPVEVSPPESAAEARVEPEPTLYVAADGTLAFREARGEAVFEALAAADLSEKGLLMRADRTVAGSEIAALVARLGGLGIGRVRLVVGSG